MTMEKLVNSEPGSHESWRELAEHSLTCDNLNPNETDNEVSVPLSSNYVTVIDSADWSAVSQYKWWAEVRNHTVYARSIVGYLHNYLMNGAETDHKDRNGLNNHRNNLRQASRSQNLANKGIMPHTSKYKGVSWQTKYGCWVSQIGRDNQTFGLGYYDNEKHAAIAYDRKAIELFGEYALTNVSLGLLLPDDLNTQVSKRVYRRASLSGHPGITWHDGKWMVRIRRNGSRKFIGNYSDLDEAISAQEQTGGWLCLRN